MVRRWSEPLDVDWTPATVAERVRQLADEMSSHLAEPADVIAAVAATEAMLDAAPKVGSRGGEGARQPAAPGWRCCAWSRRSCRPSATGCCWTTAIRSPSPPGLPASRVVVAAERTAHRVVLLDEYQDTGVAQRMLLQRLFGHGHPVTAVGDPAQSIYGFRGASVGNILNFPRHFPRAVGSHAEPARQYPLTVNFRSGGAILAVANRIVAGLEYGVRRRPGAADRARAAGRAARPAAATAARSGPRCWPTRRARPTGWPTRRGRVRAAPRRRTPSAAPTRVARAGTRLRCCAAGAASSACCGRRWSGAACPVEVIGLGGLLDAPEVADIVAVLRVLHDATANAAVVRLLTGPRWRIGLRDLDALGRRAAVLVRDPHPSPDAQEPLPLQLGGDEAEVGSLSDALEQLDDPGARPARAALARGALPAAPAAR